MLNTFYLKMFDSYIEQTQNSKDIILAAVQDVQNLSMAGIRMVLKVGQALDKRSKYNLPFMTEAMDFFDAAAPVVMKMQHDLVSVSIDANLDMAKLMRKNLATRDSAKDDEGHD